jgi:hypothetical protein
VRPNSLTLIATLCAGAIVTGCGGGGDGPSAPAVPAMITLNLDFTYIEVEEDCDGIEGDGDFEFRVQTYRLPTDTAEIVYHKSVNLGPGGYSEWIGRRSYTFPATETEQRTVWFGASEMDKDVFGWTYTDSRLSYASGTLEYSYANGTWNTLGVQSIALGSDGCRVTLRWTASADAT